MRAAGGSKREAKVRVTLLGGLEHLILAIQCSAAAIVLLVEGRRTPPLDFTLPWAVGPAVGFGIALSGGGEIPRPAGVAAGAGARSFWSSYDAAHLIGRRCSSIPFAMRARSPGMLLYWLGDMWALWAAMAAFGFRMHAAAEIVAFGTAMIVTRRTGPLGGAGILMTALPPTLWYSGAPWTPAVLGVFVWRFFTLWPARASRCRALTC